MEGAPSPPPPPPRGGGGGQEGLPPPSRGGGGGGGGGYHAAHPPISFWAASTSSLTAAHDLSNAAFSSAFIAISTIRSMPPAPITTGTPTYRFFTPYSPFSSAAHGSTRFLSFR